VNGAVFDDSPLVKERNNWIAGAALIWKITESKRTVVRGLNLAPQP
jgi:hypothetical protein